MIFPICQRNADEVAFRITVVGPIDFIEAGERDNLFPDFDVHVAPELFCLEGAARRDWASFLLRLRAKFRRRLMGAAGALLLTRLAGFIDALAVIQPQLERPIGLREFVITLNE